jgi:vacuolar protein sorting-associated protein 18
MTADPVRKTYWVYTNHSLFELVAGNEDRDVWRIYLEKGNFDVALKYAKVVTKLLVLLSYHSSVLQTASQRDTVLSAQADAFFDEGRYFQAAQCYAQCSVTFEEVTLKFLDAGERDALRSYLTSRLERTRKTVGTMVQVGVSILTLYQDLTQRMMLATWLVEIYLTKCNELEDVVASESVSHDVDNLQAERSIIEDDLRQFFETYTVSLSSFCNYSIVLMLSQANLDRHTVYELIRGHGRIDMYLFYATTIGDYERVVEHWILEEEWTKAIDVISRQVGSCL